MSKIIFHSKSTLSAKINKAIGYRILICFLLAISVLIAFTLNEINSSSTQLKKNLEQQCNGLDSFIISQVMMDNDSGIQAKLKSLNQTSSGNKFYWDRKNKEITLKKMVWHFSLSWSYFYPVSGLDKTKLGTLIVTGNLLNDHDITYHFLTKIGLLLLFFISILIVLYPLSKRIPQQLFIIPINNLLSLLRERGNKTEQQKNSSDLTEELSEIHTKITVLLEDEKMRSKQTALGQLATQVAHDIRSPLLVLTRILSDLSALPEKKRIDARNAIQRVNDIANNLLTQYKNKDTETIPTAEPIAMMLESIVSEKRIQASDLNINIEFVSQDAYSAFTQVDITSFKRVISNLINNAIDAVKDNDGLITISANQQNEKIHISIKDNGFGIPKNKLHSVLEPGISYGKKEGSGLGLPYAVSKISEWQGDYSLTSELGVGTLFEIILPTVKPAAWFGETIQVPAGGTIVVLDDDNYIHQIWDERFSEDFLKKNNLSLFHFNNTHDFILFCDEKNIENSVFLLDYEIGQDEETGLSLAAMFNLGKYAMLVTSRYENNDIRENCEALGMKIIPKYFAAHVPIFVTSKKIASPTKTVFIDDDKAIRDIWQESAENANTDLTVFQNPKDFMDLMDNFSKETLIYIDSSLADNLKGEDFAKIFYEKGYTNIILATGYSKKHFQGVTWVKDIIGKNPPWG